MKKISIILIVFVFLLQHKEIKALDFSVNSDETIIYAKGIFEKGDTEKLKEIIDKIGYNAFSIGSNSCTISFNSKGGDYIEGIKLGTYIRENCIETIVEKDNVCYSACAFAFLGGSGYTKHAGPCPNRRLEYGGQLGFHSFYSESEKLISVNEGLSSGRILTALAYEYFNELGLDSKFLTKVFSKEHDNITMINTLSLINKLEITIENVPQQLIVSNLSPTGAISIFETLRTISYNSDALENMHTIQLKQLIKEIGKDNTWSITEPFIIYKIPKVFCQGQYTNIYIIGSSVNKDRFNCLYFEKNLNTNTVNEKYVPKSGKIIIPLQDNNIPLWQ